LNGTASERQGSFGDCEDIPKARVGGIFVAGEIHRALEERLGRKAALASAYNPLHRNGWRKLASPLNAKISTSPRFSKRRSLKNSHQRIVDYRKR
jgi:hypothetical protein